MYFFFNLFQNFIFCIYFLATGALGHGENSHKYTPTPIQALRNTPPIKIITTGYRFALAINGIKIIFFMINSNLLKRKK